MRRRLLIAQPSLSLTLLSSVPTAKEAAQDAADSWGVESPHVAGHLSMRIAAGALQLRRGLDEVRSDSGYDGLDLAALGLVVEMGGSTDDSSFSWVWMRLV